MDWKHVLMVWSCAGLGCGTGSSDDVAGSTTAGDTSGVGEQGETSGASTGAATSMDASTSPSGTTAPFETGGNGPPCPAGYLFEALPSGAVGDAYSYDAPPTSEPNDWRAVFDAEVPGLEFYSAEADIVGVPEVAGRYEINAHLENQDGGQCHSVVLTLLIEAGSATTDGSSSDTTAGETTAGDASTSG